MKELDRFRQFLAEGQINENIEQIFKDTYEGYAEGFQGDPDEVDEFTWEAEEMTDPENYEDDRIAQFKAMQDYLKKNKQHTDTIYGAKVTFTLEPNGEDIKMVSDPTGGEQMNEGELPKGSPAMEENEIQDFLSRQIPEEWPGSWTGDMMTGTFTAPYEHIMLATDQEDVEDYFYEREEMINQLPTEWVKVGEYTTGKHNGIDYQVMNFAKYVPGEGVYVAATTDEIGGLNENELLNEGLNVTIASRKISFSDKEVGYIQDISRKGNQNEFSPYGIVADVMGKGSQGKSGSIAMITNFEEWMSSDGKGVRAEIKLLNGLDSEGVVVPNLLMIKKDSLNAVINRLKSEYENQLKSLELKLSSLEKI